MRTARMLPFAATALAGALIAGGSALAASPPVATTGPAKEVAPTTATLTGAVAPGGQATTYAFQYGQSTDYASETATQTANASSTTQPATATIAGLRPGTTYHFRLVASGAGGNAAGSDGTFTTAGVAPPAGGLPAAATGTANVTDSHDAVLTGTIAPSATPVRYYFQLGTGVPYDVQTLPAQAPGSTAPQTVSAPVSGLAGATTYHYRLVVAGEAAEVAAGADHTFSTSELGRINPLGLVVRAFPEVQRRLPAVVTVSGTLQYPASLTASRACKGYVTVTFRRAHEVAIQVLRAGLHSNCTFSLPVRFSDARRLQGGHIVVEVVFPGNHALRRATTRRAVQIG